MFCPYCGRTFEGENLRNCPFCGQDLTYDEGILYKLRSGRKTVVASGIAVMAVLVCLLAFFIVDNGGPGEGPIVNPDNSIILQVDSSRYIELTDDFTTGELNAYLNNSGELIIYLDSGIANGYESYVWVLRDDLSNTYRTATKTEPEAKWTDPDVGLFAIMAYCYVHESDDKAAATYYGGMTYYGDKTLNYAWDYGGERVSVSSALTRDDIERYRSGTAVQDSLRHGEALADAVRFITPGGSIGSLQKSLRSAFDSSYGYSDAAYADFLLSFVRECFDYAPDAKNYGVEQYRAFPVETLLAGSGDSEDLCVLYASLLQSAGIGCGIIGLPDYCMVAVAVQMKAPRDVSDGFVFKEFSRGGSRYVAADPLVGPSLGLMRDCFGFDLIRGVYTYYGERYTGDYGLAVAR